MTTSSVFPRLRYFDPASAESRSLDVDLCVYGGTSGGVMAAIEGCRMGLRVVLVAPERRLGGMTTGGLGMTDIGSREAIGGLAHEFYRRVGAHYGVDIEWRFEPGVEIEDAFERGRGDHRIQAYNFRMCLTHDPALRLPFERPEGYDASEYTLLKRVAAPGWDEWYEKFDPV